MKIFYVGQLDIKWPGKSSFYNLWLSKSFRYKLDEFFWWAWHENTIPPRMDGVALLMGLLLALPSPFDRGSSQIIPSGATQSS
jgi:hypothetical protein